MTKIQTYALIALALLFVSLYFLAPILSPFLLAFLIAYLGDPAADKLEDYGISRTVSVLIIYAVATVVILPAVLYLFFLIQKQLGVLINNLPMYIDYLSNWFVADLQDWLGLDMAMPDKEAIKATLGQQLGSNGMQNMLLQMLKTISQSGMVLMAWLMNIVLVPVIAFYLLRDYDKLVAYIGDLIPRHYYDKVAGLARESDDVLAGFIRGQLMVMIALSLLYMVGLSIVGLELALLVGLVAGLLSFIPYMGLLVGIALAGVAMALQTQSLTDIALVIGVFVMAQLIEAMFLTPYLVGDRIGLHPVTVIFSVLAGGQLFGFFGVLLALPVAAILAVLLRHLHNSYKHSPAYR